MFYKVFKLIICYKFAEHTKVVLLMVFMLFEFFILKLAILYALYLNYEHLKTIYLSTK